MYDGAGARRLGTARGSRWCDAEDGAVTKTPRLPTRRARRAAADCRCVLATARAALRRRLAVGSVPRAPTPTFLLRDRQGRFLGEVGRRRGRRARLLAGSRRCRERVVAATLAIEDRRFCAPPRRRPARASPGPLRRTCGAAGASRAPRRSRCRSRACSAPGARTLLAQGASRRSTACSLTRAPRPRRRARATTCARALRQPHPRHRLRGAPLPRQAGRGPVAGPRSPSSPRSRRRPAG